MNEKIKDYQLTPLIERYKLFQIGEDVKNVADELKSYDENFEEFLVEDFLINQTIMKSKFMENVFRYIVSDFKNNLSIDYIKKIEDIYKNEDLVNYPNQNIYMIESLLDPWLSNKPEKENKRLFGGISF